MYERRGEPLLPRAAFLHRFARHAAASLGMVGGSLAIGVVGYRYLVDMDWLNALLNASMILGGMGPVDPIRTTWGKLFASFYALYSGLVVLVAAGVLFAPVFHRFLHRFHMETDSASE